MVDGVLLLVDASEGPLPQTRFVLRKALEAQLPVILVVNKVDRPDARIAEVVDEVYELFLDLDADSEQIEFPIVYTNARAGWASLQEGVEGTDLSPLFELMLARIPAPAFEPGHPCRPWSPTSTPTPTSAASPSAGFTTGPSGPARQIAWCRTDGSVERATVSELYVTEALERVAAAEAGPGEIIAVAGLAEVTIGETLADPEDPRPLPVITVDEPSISVIVGINTAPTAGTRGIEADRPPDPRPPRRRAGRQRLDPRPRDRPSRRLGGAGTRRAAAGRPARADAARGLRADRRPAAGRHPRDRRRGPRAGRAAGDRHPRGLRRRRHPDAGAAQGPPRADGQPLHRLGADGVPGAGQGPDRLPHRVPDRDPRHRDPPPRLRPLGALGRRDADEADRGAGRRSPRHRPPASPSSACRSAAPCSSAPARRSTRG